MKQITILLGLLIGSTILCSCSLFTRKHHNGIAVEVNGNYLDYTKLDELTAGLKPEDSTAVANIFIRQWATDILVYEKAYKNVEDKQIEALVEDYRRSLYTHAYDQHLLNHMPNKISEELIDSFYQDHKNQYMLRDGIIRGLLVIVPNGAPDMDKVKKYVASRTEKDLENLEKYAYRYASGYELFTDEWKTVSQLLVWLPITKVDLLKQLKEGTQVVLSDSVSTYVLQPIEVCQAGTPMPIEYARSEIEPILLRERINIFLEAEHERIYNDAIRFKKIRFYEKK